MGLNVFRRIFNIRRFGDEENVDGYKIAPYEDFSAMLNVQPLSSDDVAALPEGERRFKHMKAYGDFEFTPADQQTGKRGDWLYYRGQFDPQGHWYECRSAVGWDHTPLHHCKAEFVQVAETEIYSLTPPLTEEQKEEEKLTPNTAGDRGVVVK